jgi:tetrapyrrole methylase family protein / MazG family protein
MPGKITIVGLGPGGAGRRTVAVQAALDTAVAVFVRSHEGVDLGDLLVRDNVTDIGRTYNRGADPANRWDSAVEGICAAASDGDVVLGIPGHPRYGEGLVRGTLKAAEARGIATEMLDGISVLDLIATALDVDPLLDGAQLFNAREIAAQMARDPFAGGVFTGSPHRPMLFTHVYDDALRDGMAKALARVLPPDHPVIRIEAVGMAEQRVSEHTIGELAGVSAGQLVAFWVPPAGELDGGRDPRTLQHIVARLRQPDGCPWDRKQTNATLRDALIDEVYEAADAIDAGDMDNLAEELGDLFLLIAMHAQIAEEAGHFTLEDVYEGIATKIVRRHPHVFGDEAAEHAEEVVGLWQRIKAEEKANGKASTKAPDGQPRSMPALERASRVLKKHPLPASGTDDHDPGDRLLAAIAGIIEDGDDPDAVLRAALERHVANVEPNP